MLSKKTPSSMQNVGGRHKYQKKPSPCKMQGRVTRRDAAPPSWVVLGPTRVATLPPSFPSHSRGRVTVSPFHSSPCHNLCCCAPIMQKGPRVRSPCSRIIMLPANSSSKYHNVATVFCGNFNKL